VPTITTTTAADGTQKFTAVISMLTPWPANVTGAPTIAVFVPGKAVEKESAVLASCNEIITPAGQ
jgi:hypothetical protein